MNRQRKISLFAVCLIIVGLLIVIVPVLSASREDKLLWRAALELNSDHYSVAETLANEVLKLNPLSSEAALIAGNAAAGLHEHNRAINYYKQVTSGSEDFETLAALGLGQRWLKLGDIEKAEENFRKVLDIDPNNFEANKSYAYLMQIQGRTWESVTPTMRMIRLGLFGATEIHIAGSPEERFLYDERYMNLVRQTAPHSVKPMLAEAKLAKLESRTDQARNLYESIIEQHPDFVEPYTQLGRIYLDHNLLAEYQELHKKIPEGAGNDPAAWTNQGIYSISLNQPQQAARCFYEALKLAPNRVETTYQLSQVLVDLGEAELATEIAQRAKRLAFIELTIPEFYDDPTPERAYTLLQKFQEIDRYWEAAAICHFALRYYRETPIWVDAELNRTANMLRDSGADLFPHNGLTKLRILEQFPLPDISDSKETFHDSSNSLVDLPQIRFEDRTQQAGLEFTYFNGSLSTRGMEHIFETTGGGVVAIDFDCDYWTDLYLCQGAAIWEGDDPVERTDHLFRNRQGKFENVARQSMLGDIDFSQGATTGDFNNDGFPDLYVCNLERNRFYENNGDGTFTEVTAQTGTAGDDWSLSSVLADLNNDQLPDLYVVNYLDRAAVFEQRCKRNGEPLTCAPTMFPAAQDRVYINQGDGRFIDETESSGIVQPEGKGLAILAADLDHSGRLSLFVGNDTTPNFLLSNRTAKDGKILFEETGLLSGLALDGGGRSQATMGVAYGDILGSEDGELFITNFYGDSNTFYLHESPGLFVDYSKQSNLTEPSLLTLGFGTEFLDADLNGELDLFVTNGHVDRTFATGEPDEMAPQFFYNIGQGEFKLLPEETGDYFGKKFLGRTVSRIDWNRDGREDLCVLHLYSSVALLTNETKSTGNFVKFHLKSINGARDAIGTTVQVKVGDQLLTQQLVTGDGYMTSNERQLTFGLGDEDLIDEVKISWANGSSRTYRDVAANKEYLMIEGKNQVTPLINQ